MGLRSVYRQYPPQQITMELRRTLRPEVPHLSEGAKGITTAGRPQALRSAAAFLQFFEKISRCHPPPPLRGSETTKTDLTFHSG